MNVVANVAWTNDVTRGKRCAADDVTYMLGDDLFISDAVLYGANSRTVGKEGRGVLDCQLSMDALGRNDSKIAARQVGDIGRCLQGDGEFGRA